MLLSALLEGYPMKAAAQWEADLGPITGEEALKSSQHLLSECNAKSDPIVYPVESTLYPSKTT